MSYDNYMLNYLKNAKLFFQGAHIILESHWRCIYFSISSISSHLHHHLLLSSFLIPDILVKASIYIICFCGLS